MSTSMDASRDSTHDGCLWATHCVAHALWTGEWAIEHTGCSVAGGCVACPNLFYRTDVGECGERLIGYPPNVLAFLEG